MGIIDDYLTGATKDEAPAAVTSKGSLINEYMASPVEPIKTEKLVPAGAPVNGKVEYISEREAKQREYKGGPTTRPFPSLKENVGNKAMEGVGEVVEGVKDVFNNKPASGLGRAGVGALSTLVSIPTGAAAWTDKIVGKPDVASNSDYDNPASIGDKALLITGGALPVKGVGVVASKLPKNEAFRKLVEDIGPANAGFVAKEMRANPNLTPADLSPAVKQGVQKLFAGVEGPHVNYLGATTEQRLAKAADDLEQHMNINLGNTVDPVKKLKELKDNIRAVGKEKINPALAGAKPVDTNSVVKFIDEIANPGINSKLNLETGLTSTDITKELNSIKQYLTDGKSFRTDPDQLNDIQSMFRVVSEKLSSSTDGPSKRMGAIIGEVRNKLVDAIDNASGGKYKPALKEYRDEFHIQDAFEYGNDAIMKNSKNLKDHPAFFEQKIKDMSDKEVEAAKEGARLAYDAQMNAFKHAARRGTDIGDVEFNRRRMTVLFGKEEAEKMFKIFEDAKRVADTNNKLVQGSQTQMRNVQDSYFAPYKPPAEGSSVERAVNVGLPVAAEAAGQYLFGTPAVGAVAAGAGLAGLKYGSKAVSAAKTHAIEALERNRNMSYSKMALPTNGPDRDWLIQQLEAVANAPPKQSLISKVKSALPTVSP